MKGDSTTIKRRYTDYFERGAKHYHESHYFNPGGYAPMQYRQAYIERLIQSQDLPSGSRVLDVGCGPGQLLLSLVKKGYDVWGVDIAQAMVDEAVELLETNGFPAAEQISVGDVEDLKFDDDFFDVVVASGVIEYQKSDDRSLSEMHRVVRPGGFIVLNVSNRYSYSGMFVAFYLWANRHRSTKALLRFIKGRILHRGELNEFPDRRFHSPAAFDRELAAHHFQKVAHHYFHFSALPIPFDGLVDGQSKRRGERMERFTDRPAGRWLGGGYIVCARKESGPG